MRAKRLGSVWVGMALCFGLFMGCLDRQLPKPKGFLALEYPQPDYIMLKSRAVEYSFEYNQFARPIATLFESVRLEYPTMKASIYLNYRKIENNLDSLLYDAYLVPYRHLAKAESIPERVFVNHSQRVYGQLFTVVGDAASHYQFFLTDSLEHFVLGSLYFFTRPNYDSIYPAAKYIERDIVHLMETFRWK